MSNTWIFQGNPDRFDVSRYITDFDYIYWYVRFQSHGDQMKIGDSVYIWRASGVQSQTAGIIATGKINERCKPVSDLNHPEYLALDYWETGEVDPSELKVGVSIVNKRISQESNMLTRKTIAKNKILKSLPIITAGVGSNFILEARQAEELHSLWSEGQVDEADESIQMFGEIDGYPEGSKFETRMQIKGAGLHKYHINGISRVLNIGCDSIVLNGGYVDDRDFGHEILYTGEGGRPEGSTRQEFDQSLLKGNLDLSRNKITRQPIRVIRGSKHFEPEFAPESGYRYDGLFFLEDYWPDIGVDGFRIWRYKLVKTHRINLLQAQTGNKPTQRRERSSSQIIRDPRLPDRLKKMYDYTCQVCGIRLEANGIPYAEGAHIKGLGSPHEGSDTTNNMIILCPNDHHLFDAFGFAINDDLTFLGLDGRLSVHKNHLINSDNIKYHRSKYEIASRKSNL
jgi:putative restriction endonuclease